MFSVFRGTKYDDIRPNHTKKTKNNNKNNQNNQKPTHMVIDFFLDRTKKILVHHLHRPNGAKILRFGNFPHNVTCQGGVEIVKNQSHLVKFGSVLVGILP